MSDLADFSAVDLVEAYRLRKLSPIEVVEAVIARIDASESKLNALWAYDPDEARKVAKASEARWAKGEPLGAIDGAPVTIKENIATKGTPVSLGCAAVPLVPAAADAPPAARTREAGGIILAKTTMPDYGMLSSGLSSFHKLARNPWDLSASPGGSSAGAGVAAAAGYGPLHIGTDIGGSIRLPAGWCGVVGLKPSAGRIPINPAFIGRVAGPMTRTVADTALYMSVLSKPDARDTMALPYADIPWLDLARDVKGLKIGLWLEAGFGQTVSEETEQAVKQAAKLFADAGAILEPVAPFLTREMIDGLDRFWRARGWEDVSRLAPEQQAQILPYIFDWIETAKDFSGRDVYTGFTQIESMRNALHAGLTGFDFILSPTAPTPSFPAEWASPINDPQKPFEHIAFTVAANMGGQPAISINCGYAANGLPIGLQIIGQPFDDIGVLRLARAFESLRPQQRPWPKVAA
ncbi:amidase [Sinorhizobium psoraleae]|uniref:Amidase n=1 Tax=Sinorhizobium psoraleae TaxID=520838 RepID=A0ABT4KNC6_9HYPH|nr:amidase [Sinorhizobium psoraleae]MCZ4093485.1 amidase [Sinorhizobium psoraleae]